MATGEVYEINPKVNGDVVLVIHGTPAFMEYLRGVMASLTRVTGGTTTRDTEEISGKLVRDTITITGSRITTEGIDDVVDAWFDLVEAGFRDQLFGSNRTRKQAPDVARGLIAHSERH